ncbi:MAG: zinc ribbon domain-containing protein [Candidatus Brocadiia bacterium]
MEPVICPKCGSSYGPEVKFCPADGTPLTNQAPLHRHCQTCGTEYPEGVNFCPADGGRIEISIAGGSPFAQKDIEEVCRNGYDFEIGGILRESAALLHKRYWFFFGVFVVWFVIERGLGSLPVVGNHAGLIISPLLLGGLISMFLAASTGKEPHFSLLFSQFSPKFIPLVVANILIIIITIIPVAFTAFFGLGILLKASYVTQDVLSPLYDFFHRYDKGGFADFVNGPAGSLLFDMEWLNILLLFALSFFVALVVVTCVTFVNILIVDRMNNPIEAIRKSNSLAHKQTKKIMSLITIMVLLNLVAVIPLGLGLLYTVPLTFAVFVTLYVKAVGVKTVYE